MLINFGHSRIASNSKHRKWIAGVNPLFLSACFYPDVDEEPCYQMALYTGWVSLPRKCPISFLVLLTTSQQLYLWDDGKYKQLMS